MGEHSVEKASDISVLSPSGRRVEFFLLNRHDLSLQSFTFAQTTLNSITYEEENVFVHGIIINPIQLLQVWRSVV